jgi:hypothetical protein
MVNGSEMKNHQFTIAVCGVDRFLILQSPFSIFNFQLAIIHRFDKSYLPAMKKLRHQSMT